MLALVLFAVALFFAGICTKLSMSRRVALLALGYVIFTATAIGVATFPLTGSL